MPTLPFEFVMLHHSLTKDSGTVSWGAIRRYHVETLGWAGIGYHFGIEFVADPGVSDGGSYEVLLGRTLDRTGAHCYQAGMNRRAIGICLVGNFDLAAPCEASLAVATSLVRWLLSLIGKGAEAIIGHRDFAPYKSCPGSRFDLDAFRGRVH